MIKDLSASLVAAAAAINQKSREAFVAEQKDLQARKTVKMPMQPLPKADPAAVSTAKKMAEAVEGTVPKTPKEKELAAKHGHPKRITFGDVLKARGVRKEEAVQEGMMDTMKKIGKKIVDTATHGSDEDLIKDLQKKTGVPQTGKKPVAEASGWNPIKHIPKEKQSDAIKTAAKDVKRGSYADRAALLKAGGVRKEEIIRAASDLKEAKVDAITHHQNMHDHHQAHAEIHADASRDAEDEDEESHHDSAEEEHMDGAIAHKEALDAHKNNSPDKKQLSYHANMQSKRTKSFYGEEVEHEKAGKKPNAFNWRTNPTKLPKKPGELTGHDSKKISTGTVYTKKYTNEDTSYSVEHEMFGEGNTLPGQQAEDGSWIDVMFAEGIKRVPADELFVTEAKVGDSHIHVSPVGGGKYKVHAVGSKFASGIKVGEHLTDTHLDDFAEMGGKIKHVKAEKKD